MSYWFDAIQGIIYFQTEFEDDRQKFLKIYTDIIEKLRILSAENWTML